MSDVQCQMSSIRRLLSEVCLMSHVWYLMSYVCCQTSDVWHRATNSRRLISNVKGLMFVVWSLISDVCCQTSDVRCLMFVVWCQLSVVWYETSDVCCLMSDVWCHTSDIWCLMFVVRRLTWESDIRQQASDIRHLISDICFLMSDVCCLMSDVCSVICCPMSDVCPCIRNPAGQGSKPGLKAWVRLGFGRVGQGIKIPGKPRPQRQPSLAWAQLAEAKIEKAKQKT